MDGTDASSSQDKLLSEVLQRFAGNAQDGKTQPQSSPPPDILSSLLSNPELLSRIPQIISTVMPLLDAMRGSASPSNARADTDAHRSAPAGESVSPALPVFPAAKAQEKHQADRAALLCAMKPYLCRDRQNAIDYIIKLSRLGDILKTL